ncbi:MAG: hypothetical protein OEW12_02700 [Deltaproteobacteria bacterium]|nr:hypothetical protein [Deltaproteobacteria bacterium]
MGIIRLVLIGMAVYIGYSLLRKIFAVNGGGKVNQRINRLVQDPQCKVYVDPQYAVIKKVNRGEMFFCSEECAREFLKGSGKGG